jgi:hypothetical protein
MLWIAIGGAAVAVVAVVVVIAMTGGDRRRRRTRPRHPRPRPATRAAGSRRRSEHRLRSLRQSAGTMTWRLDGEARTDALPSRIRGISPGCTPVAIDAPAGFMSQNMRSRSKLGKAPQRRHRAPAARHHGTFSSDPPGATVSLIVDGKRETLGPSPAKMKLDPRKTYQVLFEKTGYVSVNSPIVFTGSATNHLVVLEKAGASHRPRRRRRRNAEPSERSDATEDRTSRRSRRRRRDAEAERPRTEDSEDRDAQGERRRRRRQAVAKGEGTLLLGSKPPCDIFIDGKATGMQTPQRDIKLPSGKHKITLVNNEFGSKRRSPSTSKRTPSRSRSKTTRTAFRSSAIRRARGRVA